MATRERRLATREKAKEKNKGGRPTTYKPEYDKIAYDLLSKGESIAAVSVALDTHREMIYQWSDANPNFAYSIKKGLEASQRFYEQLLRAKVSGRSLEGFDPKKADTTCLIFLLKTRFHRDYSEKNKLEINQGKININITADDANL